ncbi:MAG: hypothetical protein AB7O97_16960 [Planctomycetota bacterium]
MQPRALAARLFPLVLAPIVSAQTPNFLGFTTGFLASFADRAGANPASDVDVLQRFDPRSYRHWLLSQADPTGGTKELTAVRIELQDQIGNTPETYNVVGYEGTGIGGITDPEYLPDRSAPPWFRTGPLQTPPSISTGALRMTVLIGVGVPQAPERYLPGVSGQRERVWLGVGLGGGNWPTDGLGVVMSSSTSPASVAPPGDVVGPRIQDAGILSGASANYVGRREYAVPPAGVLPFDPSLLVLDGMPATANGGWRQLGLEVLARTTAGVCLTQTNQPGYPASVAPGATANMLSGLHPDINNSTASQSPPAGYPARADDIGFLVTERNMPNAFVVVSMAFGPFAGGPLGDGSLPIASVPGFTAPGSAGVLCVDAFGPSLSFFGFSDDNGRFRVMLNLDAAARAVIAGLQPLDVWWQGFVLDPSGSPMRARGTGCVIQHL